MRKYIAFILSMLVFVACNQKTDKEEAVADMFMDVVSFIEEQGDFINSEIAPAMINASVLVQRLKENVLVIDIRPREGYNKAHIPGAVNVVMSNMLEYFEEVIDPFAFDTIVFVSVDGQAAAFTTSVFRLLGYHHVFALRWGMSSWHSDFASKNWSAVLSSNLESKLEKTASPPKKSNSFPSIMSNHRHPYQLIRERAEELLNTPFHNTQLIVDQVLKNNNRYYIVNYWDEKAYMSGHLPGAVQYDPKKSLSYKTDLKTLPPDRSIVIYCFSGQHSASVTAYLRLLGYDAYSLKFGANSFMVNMLRNGLGHFFNPDAVEDYPLEEAREDAPFEFKTEIEDNKKQTPQGGC